MSQLMSHYNYMNTPSISKIKDRLYLGDEAGAKDVDGLKKREITFVCGFTKESDYEHDPDIDYHHVSIVDSSTTSLLELFDPIYDLIKCSIDYGDVVYVHCLAGVSRSASIVIAYLMRDNNWSYAYAYRYVKSKRQCICPNPGFVRQLKVYRAILRRKALQS